MRIDNHVAIAQREHRIVGVVSQSLKIKHLFVRPHTLLLYYHSCVTGGRAGNCPGKGDGRVIGVPKAEKYLIPRVVLSTEAGQVFGAGGVEASYRFQYRNGRELGVGPGRALIETGVFEKGENRQKGKEDVEHP